MCDSSRTLIHEVVGNSINSIFSIVIKINDTYQEWYIINAQSDTNERD